MYVKQLITLYYTYKYNSVDVAAALSLWHRFWNHISEEPLALPKVSDAGNHARKWQKRVCFNHKTGHHEFGVATNSSTWPALPDVLIVVS